MTQSAQDKCTDHVHPGLFRLLIARGILKVLRRVLWGYTVHAVPPCVMQMYHEALFGPASQAAESSSSEPPSHNLGGYA